MENHMGKNMDNELETGLIRWLNEGLAKREQLLIQF